MPIKVEPTGAALGARVTGIDLSRELTATEIAEIRAAWLDHLVLIFPDQVLSEADQVRFTQYFGEMPLRKRYEGRQNADAAYKSIMLVTNVRENDKPIGSLPDGEMMFHSDGAYDPDPYMYTLLYAVELPSWGGDTLFANMYRAYEMIPGALKARLRGSCGVQGYYSGAVTTADRDGNYSGEVQHPLFIRHAETGRTALYASRLMTVGIAGIAESEAVEILGTLFDLTEQADNIYAHKWSIGDFVMWDNRCVTHARTDFPRNERRMLRRSTVQGVRPEMAI
ncbi:MAG: hypothetical protein RLZ98_2119 [Pseudomonadota bacterium]|jgi:taurine dioxygenase